MDLYESVVDSIVNDEKQDDINILPGDIQSGEDATNNNIEDNEANEIEYMGEDADYETMGMDGDEQY